MKNKKNLYILSGFFVALIALMFFVPHLVSAASNANSNYGLDATAQSAGLPMTKDLAVVLGNVIGSALSFISVLFFGLMLYGGFTWMTARGKSESTQKALDTIIAATIGIVIVLAAYAITNFVFSNTISGAGGASVSPVGQSGVGGPVGASCNTDNNCDMSHLYCNDGSCAEISARVGGPVGASCNTDNNCISGLSCVDGNCKTNP